jgi:hypothetical protein
LELQQSENVQCLQKRSKYKTRQNTHPIALDYIP